jgi:steroid 5-alpha reductase family enzyme
MSKKKVNWFDLWWSFCVRLAALVGVFRYLVHSPWSDLSIALLVLMVISIVDTIRISVLESERLEG